MTRALTEGGRETACVSQCGPRGDVCGGTLHRRVESNPCPTRHRIAHWVNDMSEMTRVGRCSDGGGQRLLVRVHPGRSGQERMCCAQTCAVLCCTGGLVCHQCHHLHRWYSLVGPQSLDKSARVTRLSGRNRGGRQN